MNDKLKECNQTTCCGVANCKLYYCNLEKAINLVHYKIDSSLVSFALESAKYLTKEAIFTKSKLDLEVYDILRCALIDMGYDDIWID